jgi:glycerol-3-phosphate acyltransferase PlsY
MMAMLAAILTAYLIGSIPFSFLMGKLYGVDIRKIGSGNVGATNLKRAISDRRMGRPACWLALFLDAAKGFAPAFFLADTFARHGTIIPTEWLRVAMGLSAVAGHSFTIFLKFRGGKGVATSAGAVFAIAPLEACVALAVWLAVRALSGYVSAASCAAAAALPVATVAIRSGDLAGEGLPPFVFGISAAILVIARHRDNLVRLWRGTELPAGSAGKSGEAARGEYDAGQPSADRGKLDGRPDGKCGEQEGKKGSEKCVDGSIG